MNYEIQFAQLGEESKLIFQSLKLMNQFANIIYTSLLITALFMLSYFIDKLPKAFIQYDPLQKK